MFRLVHWMPGDPGTHFVRDTAPAIEKPEGGGIYGTNTPNVVVIPEGGLAPARHETP